MWDDVDGREYPAPIREMILEPALTTLQVELKDVCASDCERVSTDLELLQEPEVTTYWDRLRLSEGEANDESQRILTIESHDKPCKVGFAVGREVGCPLCHIEKPQSNISEFIKIAGDVVRFRSAEGHE